MTAFYNEIDPFAAAWLRRLIDAGHIAPGVVDERDIRDIEPHELQRFDQCHFFAGLGVWSYALRLAGVPDDAKVWTGSCPCQPFSAIGRGDGFDDQRHLWPSFFHLIDKCRPPVVFGEQVASKDGLAWLDLVQTDMEGTGYAFAAFDLCAAGFGAPHRRQRLYFVADGGLVHAERAGLEGHTRDVDDAGGRAQSDRPAPAPGRTGGFWADAEWIACRDGYQRPIEPGTFPMAHGAAERMGRLRGYGNAIVAPQAAEFIKAYIEAEGGR